MRFTEKEVEFVRKGSGPIGMRAFLHRAMGFGSGIRGQRSNYGVRGGTVRPDCHIAGTIVTTEYGTMPVELQPGAIIGEYEETCKEVSLYGLPTKEVVSNDHKYWAKICSRNKCVEDPQTNEKLKRYSETEAKWTSIDEMTNDYWIGSSINTEVLSIKPIEQTTKVTTINTRNEKGMIVKATNTFTKSLEVAPPEKLMVVVIWTVAW